MSIKKATIKTCDVCGRKVYDQGEAWIGGHPFSGWFEVNQHGGSTALHELRKTRSWDVCSQACLIKLATNLQEYQNESNQLS